VFIALGFIDHLAGMAKGDNSLWAYVSLLLEGRHNTGALLQAVACRSLLQAVAALLLGWVIQAIVVAVCSSVHRWYAARKPFTSGSE